MRLENKSVWFGKKGENQLFECPEFQVGDTKKFMKHEIISKQRETFFVEEWFFSERFLSKFLEDDELKSVFWDFWEYYWEFWESNSTQPPHKWTLRIFLDE